MDESFESRVRAATPQDADYMRIHADRVLMVELPDGRLIASVTGGSEALGGWWRYLGRAGTDARRRRAAGGAGASYLAALGWLGPALLG